MEGEQQQQPEKAWRTSETGKAVCGRCRSLAPRAGLPCRRQPQPLVFAPYGGCPDREEWTQLISAVVRLANVKQTLARSGSCTAGCLGTLLAGTRQWRRRLAQRCSSSGFFRPRTSRLMARPIYRRTGITATSAVMQRANLYILIGFFLPQSLGGCRCTASSIRGYDAPAATQK